MAQSARRELLSMGLKRKAAGQSRYCLTEIPSHAAAQVAQMPLSAYTDWVFRAGFLHLPDPVAAWQTLDEQHQRVIEYLSNKHALHFRVPSRNTDLTVDVSGMKWVSCAGGDNFPDGEVYSGPRAVDGIVNFTFHAAFKGKEVDGIRLKFKSGRVVEASATKNEDYLINLLDQDQGARNAGEIAIGTNYHLTGFTRNAFFDEKIGGTFHIAVGAGYPETGNTNESGLHWDLVCDLRPDATGRGGTIHADGELFHQDGRFLRAGWPGT